MSTLVPPLVTPLTVHSSGCATFLTLKFMLSNRQNAGGSLALFCALLLYSAMGWAQAPALSVPLSARFTVQRFGEQLGLGVVTVTTMAQDRQGFLWIGTQTGLFRYDGARLQKWPEVDKIAGHY